MRIWLFMLMVALGLSHPSHADPLSFQEHNFQIELPISWESKPAPNGVLCIYEPKDGSKMFLIIVGKFSEESDAQALDKMFLGAKSSADEAGFEIKPVNTTLDGVPFRHYGFKRPDGVSTVSYLGVYDNVGYSLQAISGTSEAATDAELLSIINSFKLLEKTLPTAAKAQPKQTEDVAFQFGQMVGQIAIIVFIVGAIIISITNVRKKKASSAVEG